MKLGLFLIALTFSLTSFADEVPGVFYRVDQPMDQSVATLQRQIAQSHPNVQTGSITRGRGNAQARLTGLTHCLSRGVEGVGAVFWSRSRLTGAHCLDNMGQRDANLRNTFIAGCNILGYSSSPESNCAPHRNAGRTLIVKAANDGATSSDEASAVDCVSGSGDYIPGIDQ
ncbi:MAG: hypothetical protein HRT44_03615 [Bdellovibrionales bacterium]|nr:hypothetical protein [Bdellovibrionales bacterium]NQZ18331.1 hypothetical protein [Bdellovibrionales bacterium]